MLKDLPPELIFNIDWTGKGMKAGQLKEDQALYDPDVAEASISLEEQGSIENFKFVGAMNAAGRQMDPLMLAHVKI